MPWSRWLSFALGVLRWPPDVVWRATPRELALAARALFGAPIAAPLARADLADLMARFPDAAAR